MNLSFSVSLANCIADCARSAIRNRDLEAIFDSLFDTSVDEVVVSTSTSTNSKSNNQLDIVAQDQGNENSCGTTSLSMVLNYYGKNVSTDQLDDQIRNHDFGTAPTHIVDAAKSYGINAAIYNESNFDEIKQHIDSGHALIAMTDSFDRGSDIKAHYLVINGYDVTNGVKKLHIVNPTGAEKYTVDYNTFVHDKWSNVDLLNIDTGIDKMIIAFSPKNDLPPSRLNGRAEHCMNLFEDLANLGNSWGFISDGNILQGVEAYHQGTLGLISTFHSYVADETSQRINESIGTPAAAVLTGGLSQVASYFGNEPDTMETLMTGGLNQIDSDVATTVLTGGLNKADQDTAATVLTGGLNKVFGF